MHAWESNENRFETVKQRVWRSTRGVKLVPGVCAPPVTVQQGDVSRDIGRADSLGAHPVKSHSAACVQRALAWFKHAVILKLLASEPGSLHITEPGQAVGRSPQEVRGLLKTFPAPSAAWTVWGENSKVCS